MPASAFHARHAGTVRRQDRPVLARDLRGKPAAPGERRIRPRARRLPCLFVCLFVCVFVWLVACAAASVEFWLAFRLFVWLFVCASQRSPPSTDGSGRPRSCCACCRQRLGRTRCRSAILASTPGQEVPGSTRKGWAVPGRAGQYQEGLGSTAQSLTVLGRSTAIRSAQAMNAPRPTPRPPRTHPPRTNKQTTKRNGADPVLLLTLPTSAPGLDPPRSHCTGLTPPTSAHALGLPRPHLRWD